MPLGLTVACPVLRIVLHLYIFIHSSPLASSARKKGIHCSYTPRPVHKGGRRGVLGADSCVLKMVVILLT